MKIIHVVSVSGGKDSTATLLLALSRIKRESLRFIFCDTGNEHEEVYRYLNYLEKTLSIRIDRLKADFSEQIKNKRMFIARDQRTKRDKSGRKLRWTNRAKRRALEVLHPTGNPFLDLCLWKGRFPSRMAQFCTTELKVYMAVSYQIDLIDAGYKVVSWQGIRRDESQKRKNAKKIERLDPGLYAFRPLVDWSADDVFECHRNHEIKPNPLYLQGCGRVGCMPCINVSKDELRQIATRFPDHIARISDWEDLVCKGSKRGYSTFFHKFKINEISDAEIFNNNKICHVIEWSKTGRGGKQFDMLNELINVDVCASAYGLCERGNHA